MQVFVHHLKPFIPYRIIELERRVSSRRSNSHTASGMEAKMREIKEDYGFVGLHMGCGPVRHPGYLNCDLNGGEFCVDASKPLAIPDDSLDYVYTEHFIEHLTFDEALLFIKECFRVLKTEGVFRCLTPDLSLLLSIADGHSELEERLIQRICNGLTSNEGACIEHGVSSEQAMLWDSRDDIANAFMRRWGHKYLWSAHHLAKAVEYVGFRKAAVMSYGVSWDPRVCLDSKERFGREWTSVVEASK